jgi:hypothetical protein
MRFFVRVPDGSRLILDVSAQTKIETVKFILFTRLGIESEDQRLYLHQSLLEDWQSLSECQIETGCAVDLFVLGPQETEDMIEEMIQAPNVQRIIRRSPNFFTEGELTDFLRDYFVITDKPELSGESGRLADQMMNQLERYPTVLYESAESALAFEESGIEAALFGIAEEPPEATVIAEPPDEPSCAPLPFLFAPEPELEPYEPMPLKFRSRSELGDSRCGLAWPPAKPQERDSSKP